MLGAQRVDVSWNNSQSPVRPQAELGALFGAPQQPVCPSVSALSSVASSVAATSHLKPGWSGSTCAGGVKHIPDFEDFI